MYSRFSFLSILLGCGINLFAAAEELPPVPEIRDKGNKLVKNYLDAEFADTWLMIPGAPAENYAAAAPEDNGLLFQYRQNKFPLRSLPGQEKLDECVVYGIILAPADGKMRIGASCNSNFEVFCNGEQVCAGTKIDSNPELYAEDYPFIIDVKKGENLLALHLKRGTPDFKFVCREVSNEPSIAEVVFGPWPTNPGNGSMDIRFLTGNDIAAGIEYRIQGSGDEWQQAWYIDRSMRVRSDNHLVQLSDLVPGETYEYRIVMLPPRDYRYNIYTLERVEPLVDENIHTFKVPETESDNVSFVFTADLQYGLKYQRELFYRMFTAADCSSCDFFVFGGDFGDYNDYRREILNTGIQSMINLGADEKPLIVVRGNHELRSDEAALFAEYFALDDGRTYGIFRYGTTAFLVLDCWEDKNQYNKVYHLRYNEDKSFFREQLEYLESALQQEIWTGAKRRIVLSHGAAHSNFDGCCWQPFRVQELTDKFFDGKDPMYDLDLWLCGHSHRYLRSFPGSNVVAAPITPAAPFRTGESSTYPVFTVGGPNSKDNPIQASTFRVDITGEKITVTSFDQNGKKFDHVEILNDGTIVEKMSMPHFDTAPRDYTPDPKDSIYITE